MVAGDVYHLREQRIVNFQPLDCHVHLGIRTIRTRLSVMVRNRMAVNAVTQTNYFLYFVFGESFLQPIGKIRMSEWLMHIGKYTQWVGRFIPIYRP